MRKVKIVLLGAPAVGKTSIANRYTRNLFANRYINTIGCDFYIKNIENLDGKSYKVMIHDIGGQIEFRETRRMYMDGADIVLIVFALDDRKTWDISEFIEDVDAQAEKPVVAFVGNKRDLVDVASLDLDRIKVMASERRAGLFFTSAKENIMIQDIFTESLHLLND